MRAWRLRRLVLLLALHGDQLVPGNHGPRWHPIAWAGGPCGDGLPGSHSRGSYIVLWLVRGLASLFPVHRGRPARS